MFIRKEKKLKKTYFFQEKKIKKNKLKPNQRLTKIWGINTMSRAERGKDVEQVGLFEHVHQKS